MLSATIIRKVSQEIHRRFPDTAGATPTIRAQKKNGAEEPDYLLTFHGAGLTEDHRKINAIVRVVVNAQGKILKVSSSR